MKNSEPSMKTRKTRLQACMAMSWEKLDETDGSWGDVWKSLGTLQMLFGSEFQTAEAA